LKKEQAADRPMTETLRQIERLISDSTDSERRALRRYLSKLAPHPLEAEWEIDGDTILSAIRRSSDLTKRGVRGIIAEAVFETSVIPRLEGAGWTNMGIVGNHSFDALLRKGDVQARIQVKLQRMERGEPKQYHPKHYGEGKFYVVEVQKTRSGKKTTRVSLPSGEGGLQGTTTTSEETRPYRFTDFDVLAVNMHPSSGNWSDFRYTLASWLLPRSDQALIEIMQPVAATANNVWTDDLVNCLGWLETAEKRRVLEAPSHPSRSGKHRKG